MKELASAIIDQEDVDMLQRASEMRNGMFALLNDKTFPTDRDYEMFAKKHAEYQTAWESVLNRYFDGKYRVGNFNWDCNFVTRKVTITG